MASLRIASVTACALLSLSSIAAAQERVIPNTWFWQGHPVELNGDLSDPDPLFAPLITVTLGATTSPAAAAATTAQQVQTALALPNTWALSDGSNLCIFLKNFGHKFMDYTGEGERLCFYREEWDVASIGGLDSGDFTSPNGRPYAHPFLANTTTEEAPLKEWMEEYVDALEAEVATRSLPSPNSWRFYFDTESTVRQVDTRDDVFMLRHLYLYDSGAIWNTWAVPGTEGWVPPDSDHYYASGRTLSDMYDGIRIQFGWPLDLLDPVNGLLYNTTSDAQHPRNMPFLLWWYSICKRAEDAVMANCAYGPLKAQWPTARCGNWDAARVDGEPDYTGWYLDKQNTPTNLSPAIASNWAHASFELGYYLPRTWQDRQPGTALHNRANDDLYLWLGINGWASGDVDSPYLYPLNEGSDDPPVEAYQWRGNPGANNRGHWARNPYVPAAQQHPEIATLAYPPIQASARTAESETKFHSRLRLDRHDLESIINSYGGDHQDRLAPWVSQLATAQFTTTDTYKIGERDFRGVMAMIRAKNIPEVIFWYDARFAIDWNTAWNDTKAATRRVYESWIYKVDIASGETPPDAPGPEAELLEYTLRDPERGLSSIDLVATGDNPEIVALQVTVVGIQPLSTNDLEINLEASAPLGSLGSVQVYSSTFDQWFQLPLIDTGDYFHEIEMDQKQSITNLRRTFILRTDLFSGILDASGALHLRLVMKMDEHMSGPVPVARFDLLQVIKVPRSGTAFCEECLMPQAVMSSDMNYDENSTSSDVTAFATAWATGQTIADMNLDESFDAEDIVLFTDALATGN